MNKAVSTKGFNVNVNVISSEQTRGQYLNIAG